jgi:hypothetical protein
MAKNKTIGLVAALALGVLSTAAHADVPPASSTANVKSPGATANVYINYPDVSVQGRVRFNGPYTGGQLIVDSATGDFRSFFVVACANIFNPQDQRFPNQTRYGTRALSDGNISILCDFGYVATEVSGAVTHR